MNTPFCSQISRHESMAGTCDEVDLWLMLEYPERWARKAHEENNLPAAARQWLNDTLASLRQAGIKARLQFIRQSSERDGPRRLLLAWKGDLFLFQGAGEYSFLQSVDALDLTQNTKKYGAENGSHYFVCTNGQRDVCCSRFGLPVYKQLVAEPDGEVWQATHLGGHRFAANVLVLPQMALYGRVAVDDCKTLVANTRSGELYFDRLRGRSFLPRPAQAAEVFLKKNGLQLLNCQQQKGVWQLEFQQLSVRGSKHGRQQSVCQVRETEPYAILASCADTAEKQVRGFEVA